MRSSCMLVCVCVLCVCVWICYVGVMWCGCDVVWVWCFGRVVLLCVCSVVSVYKYVTMNEG